MPKLKLSDSAEIYYKDWGQGQPVFFSHGWPLSADAWDNQMMVFGRAGFRVIAHDRRGFGRSSQTWDNNTNERYADDLEELFQKLDLQNIVLIGHSMAGGEICRYVAQHGCTRLSKIVMAATVPPIMLQSGVNPKGVPMAMLDEIRQHIQADRADFFQTFSKMFFGFNRLTHKTQQGMLDSFWRQAMMAGIKPTYDGVAQFAEVDFTDDLRKISVPTLFIHGDDDQTVPLAASSEKAVQLVPGAVLRVYSGAPHALTLTHAEQFNTDVLAFIRTG